MEKNLKTKWVKALRSGDYRQGQDVLVNTSGTNFCCLGVLADVQGCVWRLAKHDETELVPVSPDGGRAWATDGAAYLSKSRAGGLNREKQHTLMQMNDAHKSFKEIADYIEREL